MSTQRYQHTISLTQDEQDRVLNIIPPVENGICKGLKAIFNRGLEIKEIEANVIKKAIKEL